MHNTSSTAAKNTAHPDDEYSWFREGSLPITREDLIAEGIALVALLFALSLGLVIAMLPVPARATSSSAAQAAGSMQFSVQAQ